MTALCGRGWPFTKAQRPAPRVDNVAKRLDCVELAPALVRRGQPIAPASRTHSKRFASHGAGSLPEALRTLRPPARKSELIVARAPSAAGQGTRDRPARQGRGPATEHGALYQKPCESTQLEGCSLHGLFVTLQVPRRVGSFGMIGSDQTPLGAPGSSIDRPPLRGFLGNSPVLPQTQGRPECLPAPERRNPPGFKPPLRPTCPAHPPPAVGSAGCTDALLGVEGDAFCVLHARTVFSSPARLKPSNPRTPLGPSPV